ncbi:MAG: FkbM family methyltransferase [Minisyncoccia bacterium]
MKQALRKVGVVPKELLRDILPEKPLVVDAGAHIGVDSIEMAKMWPYASIHAIEPVPHLFEVLKKNTSCFQNISTHDIALSAADGTSIMHISTGVSDASSSLHTPKEHLTRHPDVLFSETTTVNTMTLPSWMKTHEIEKIDLLWFDLQGHEYDVLLAAQHILPKISAIYTEVNLVELYEGAGNYQVLRTFLEKNGFVVMREYLPWEEAGNVLFVQRDVYEKRKIPMTAIVAGHDEGALLPECLESVDFCKERLFIDLESADGSSKKAESVGVRVIPHQLVPMVEKVRGEIARQALYDWIIFLDPDERIMPELITDLRKNLTDDVGLIKVPCVFHFKDTPLQGTVWGSRRRPLVVHKGRVSINTTVHGGYQVRLPYRTVEIERKGDNYVEHLWARSYREILNKHSRYAPLDGKARYEHGERASWKSFAYRPVRAFWESFVEKKGYRDGLVGFLLSLIYARYIAECYYHLFIHQKSVKHL